MNALELLNSGSHKLKKQKIKTHRLDSEILLSKVLNKSREQILVRLNQDIKIPEVFAFNNYIHRRSHNEPIAYIINEKEFWSKKFKVNKNTLIPRPETELLVENLINTYKGKKILQPLDKKTRPLKDITKEGIFNILEHSNILNFKIKDSKILDIFSGTGSFGIECLSREAKSVTFVENYLPAVSILKKNIVNLNLGKKSFVLINDFTKIDFTYLDDTFDLIFLDPPFKDNNISDLFEIIYSKKLIKKDSLIILHRHKKTEGDIHKDYQIIENRLYGLSKIFFLKLR